MNAVVISFHYGPNAINIYVIEDWKRAFEIIADFQAGFYVGVKVKSVYVF